MNILKREIVSTYFQSILYAINVYESFYNPKSSLLHIRDFISLKEKVKSTASTLLPALVKRILARWPVLNVFLFSKCFIFTHVE